MIRDIVLKMDQGESYQFIGGLRNNIERHAKILVENRRTDLAGKLITEAAAYTTLAAQLDDHDKDLSKSTNIELTDKELDRVIALCNYISNNLDKSNTIKELAYTSGLYPKKLQDAFQYLFNESVAAFIKNMRLEKSKELLENTNLSVGLICDKIGINSKSYFSKIFTEKYGNLPTEYRLSFNQGENSFELSYRSKARLYLPDTEVEKIVTLSEQSNKDVGITGCLIYYEEEFFQIIEGKKSDVLNLFEKIKEDERHKKVTILWKGYRKKKIFKEPGLFFVSDRKNFNYNHIKDLGITMQSLLRGDKKTAIKDLRFWQRIRNLIIDKALVG
ncbi:BLUF domain-containing protein [Winogradskyella maritima]|nr:BLUF domain-containing protein [Winogradskyella maritima]